jgi:15-cis-phytoene synthase
MRKEVAASRRERLAESYEYCRLVTQTASKTFYWGSMFLPPRKRQAIWAIYAFCRVVDDIVDEAFPVAGRSAASAGKASPAEALSYWYESLERIYRRGLPTDNPIQLAWGDMLESYAVPLKPALDMIEGVAMDLSITRYESFDDLYVYCYRVAGTVGLLTSPVFGYQNDAALIHAVDLGVALQLTNILRDIGEDARRGRVYLPQDEMLRFGYSGAELMAGVINDQFCELVRFQMARANEYYQRSLPGIAMLSEDCRLSVRLSSSLYSHILDRIRLNHYNVFTKRASVPLKTKLAAVPQYWLMQQMEARARG